MRRTSILVFSSMMLGTVAQAARAPKAAAPAAEASCAPACAAPARTRATKAAKPAGVATAKAAPTAAGNGRYSTMVNSKNQLFVGLAVDHSESNDQPVNGGENGQTKAHAIADAVNGNLEMMVALSSNGVDEENRPVFKPWFRMRAVGYSSGVRPLIEAHPGVFETADLEKSVLWLNEDGKPATKEAEMVRMKWVDPVAAGATHMGEGLNEILGDLKAFVAKNPKAPAPVVVHFTDGQPMGGRMNPIHVAREIMATGTRDGKTLMFNVHVGTSGASFVFPNRAQIDALPENIRVEARRLFEMSSPMPKHMIQKARDEFAEYDIHDDARMMVYNAPGAILTKLLEMGTIQSQPSHDAAE